MNELEIYETVKEFSVFTKLIDEPLKARISKLIPKADDEQILYFWFISHHYKPEQNSIDAYIPFRK